MFGLRDLRWNDNNHLYLFCLWQNSTLTGINNSKPFFPVQINKITHQLYYSCIVRTNNEVVKICSICKSEPGFFSFLCFVIVSNNLMKSHDRYLFHLA